MTNAVCAPVNFAAVCSAAFGGFAVIAMTRDGWQAVGYGLGSFVWLVLAAVGVYGVHAVFWHEVDREAGDDVEEIRAVFRTWWMSLPEAKRSKIRKVHPEFASRLEVH